MGTIGAQLAQVTNKESVYISSVVPNGAAFRAGLFAGDVLITVDGLRIRERGQAIYEILKWAPGSTHMVAIRRGNRELAFPVVAEAIGKSDLSDLDASIEDRARVINSMQEQKNR